MDNLLENYLNDKNIRNSEFSRMLKCASASVHKWTHNQAIPGPAYAWKIHKATKGNVPITYWGYTIINGRIRKLNDGPISIEGT